MIKNHYFKSGFNLIRTVTSNKTTLFVAKDVAAVLGHNLHFAIEEYCKKAQLIPYDMSVYVKKLGLDPSSVLIPTGDVYRLAKFSSEPYSDEFIDWITDEVIPSIRQSAHFALDFNNPAEAAAAFIKQFDRAELAISEKSQISCRREATSMNTASQAVKAVARLEREILIYENYYTIERMNRLHPNYKTKFMIRVLKKYSRLLGINSCMVCNSNNVYFHAFHIDVWHAAYHVCGEDILLEKVN